MRSFNFLVFVFLQLSLRGTDAAPTTTTASTTTTAPTTTTTTTTSTDSERGGRAPRAYRPTRPAYHPTTEPAYRPTTEPAYRPTPPPYGAVPNPTVEFEYEEVGSDYPAYQEATYGPQKHCHEEDRVTYEG